MRLPQSERVDECLQPRGLRFDVIRKIGVAFILAKAGKVGRDDMIVARQKGGEKRPIILVARKAVDEQQRRLHAIAALQIGPGAAVDGDAFLHRTAAPPEQRATDCDEAAGEDEIEDRERDQGCEEEE